MQSQRNGEFEAQEILDTTKNKQQKFGENSEEEKDENRKCYFQWNV